MCKLLHGSLTYKKIIVIYQEKERLQFNISKLLLNPRIKLRIIINNFIDNKWLENNNLI